MKRFLSPFFLISIATLICCIYILIIDESGWGFVAAIYLIPIALIVLVIDFLLKKGISKLSKVVLIELMIISVLTVAYYYGERTKTLVVPNNFDKEYVSIVYGVQKEKGLSISPLTWSKSIEIPENGILLTSSSFNTNLPETKMKFESGLYLGNEETDKYLVGIGEHEFELDGTTYQYRSWKIQEGSCCGYSSNEIKQQVEKLIDEFERKKASR